MDWKTHFVALTEAEAQRQFQPRFYLWRAMQVWPGFPSYRFTFDFVRLGKQVSVVLTPAEVQDVDDDVQAKIQLVEHARREGVWPATMGPLCGYCTLTCAAVDDARRREVRVRSDAEAREAAVEMSALEHAYKSRLEAVQAWAAANGAVTAAGRVYEWKTSASITYPVEQVVAQFAAHATPLPASLTLSHSALGSVLKAKKHRDLAQAIGQFAIEKTGKRWSDTLAHAVD